jgi:hypothetical protein
LAGFSTGEQTGKEGLLKSGINVAEVAAAGVGKATGSRGVDGSKNAEVVRLVGGTCKAGPFGGTLWSTRPGKTGRGSRREWTDKEWAGLDGASMMLGRTSEEGTGKTCPLSTSLKRIGNEATAGWFWSIDM